MKTLLILLVLMNLDKLLKTGDCTETQDQMLLITPKTQEQVNLLMNISTESTLCLPGSPEDIKEEAEVRLFVYANRVETVKDLLQKHAMTYEVLVANAKEMVEMEKRNISADRSSSAFYESYHSLEDIYHWMNMTHQENPDTVNVILIGSSFEKRPLYVMKLSLNNKPNKKAMWIDCGIHAREWISHAFCLWFVQYSLSSYKINQDITHILDNMDVYIMPVMNPDGYEYSLTTDRMWRKNRSVINGSNCIGVDLNRNFDANYTNWCKEEHSDDPCSETYCGAFPESEPESQAVVNFLRNHKDSVQLFFSIHSYSQRLLFPYFHTFDEPENYQDLNEMAQEAAENIRRYHNNTFSYGPGANTIYVAPGASIDWAYDLGIKYAFLFELQDHGTYCFLLPPSRIAEACNESLTAVKTIALKVIEKTHAPTSPPQAA
ncbi:carboxypeptidase B2-like [Plectropomus leopardus]|uniref:carboxypeptidase B2-like n=1 Tax=Plectropomus leopardus TaxID=160734 RepID=UPI001C4C9DAB|nr:carboxypeptidase B2-like [Plectropomus leopardus]